MAIPTKIGAVKAMAAIGTVAKASAPPASMPEHRQVMTSWPPVEASAKKAAGTMPQAAPRTKAFRTRRCMARRETNCGLVMRRAVRDCRPNAIAAPATAAPQISAEIRSGDDHSAMASTMALQALASMMPTE
jgi:hypothetical protein